MTKMLTFVLTPLVTTSTRVRGEASVPWGYRWSYSWTFLMISSQNKRVHLRQATEEQSSSDIKKMEILGFRVEDTRYRE